MKPEEQFADLKEKIRLVRQLRESPDRDLKINGFVQLAGIRREDAAELWDLPPGTAFERKLAALLAAKGIPQRPDFIVGGPWPGRAPGSRRDVCQVCGRYVSLGQETGDAVHRAYPDVPVICFPCAERHAHSEAAS